MQLNVVEWIRSYKIW